MIRESEENYHLRISQEKINHNLLKELENEEQKK
jgi:hypothetical protein